MENYSVDVVIVGGGPAGMAVAYTLGKNSVNTIVIDRKPYDRIGDKVCGDALSPLFTEEANKLIGLPTPSDDNGLKEIIDVSYLVGKSPQSRIILGNISNTIDRLEYGQALLHEVDTFDKISIMANTRLLEVKINQKTVTGIIGINSQGDKIDITSKVVVDASGSSGVVRSRLPETMCTKFPRKIPPEEMIVAYREILKTVDPHDYQKGIYLVYEPELKMPGYYWIFSRGPKEVNIGLGWKIYEENRGADIRAINRTIRERRFPNAEVVASGGDQIPARLPLPSCVHNGFITVGDAAALANPLNGEGHGPAIISGIHAAKEIIKAIEKRDTSEKGLWNYNKWIWHNYGKEFSFGIAIVKFVDRFGFDTFDWLMAKDIIKEDDILKMIHDHSSDLNIVRRAIKGWYKPVVLFGLWKVMRHIDEIQHLSANYPEYDNFNEWYRELKNIEAKRI